MKRLLLAGAIASVCLPGGWWALSNVVRCDETWSFSGERNYVPAHYNEWTEFHCAMHDAKGGCSATIPIQHRDFIPDKWSLLYLDHYGGQQWLEVSKDAYEKPTLHRDMFGVMRWKTCPGIAERDKG